jgi:uncharacterized membrane protein
MISYETTFDSKAKARLSEITQKCTKGILRSFVSGVVLMLVAFLLAFLFITFENRAFINVAMFLSVVSVVMTVRCLWILIRSAYKARSVMDGTDWLLPGGVTARFISIDILGNEAIFESVLPRAGHEHRCSISRKSTH